MLEQHRIETAPAESAKALASLARELLLYVEYVEYLYCDGVMSSSSPQHANENDAANNNQLPPMASCYTGTMEDY